MTYLATQGRRPNDGPLGASAERELLRRYAGGDLAARDELVEAMMPLVHHVARSYAQRGEPVEDLVQAGAIGLIRAIERFDTNRGVRLSTFARPTISGEIKRHFRDRSWVLHTPRALQELYAQVRAEATAFERVNSRSPTIAELCTLTGRNEEDVLDALNAGSNFRAASLDAALDDDQRVVGDVVGGDEPGLALAEARAVIDQGFVALTERERRILVLHYAQGLTQREIADRFGISQMHVSRLLRHSLDTLRKTLT